MPQTTARSENLLRAAAQVFVTKAAPQLAVLAVLVGYSRALPEADYGRYTAVWVRLGIVGTLAYAGVPLLLLSLPAGQVKHWAAGLKRKHYWVGIGWLAVFSAAFAWMQWRESDVLPVLSAALVVLYAGASIGEAALIVARRQQALGWGGVAYAFLYAGAHWLALRGTYSLNALLTMLVALQTARLLWYGWMTRSAYHSTPAEPLPDPSRTRRYWLHTGLYDLSVNVARFADKAAISFLLAAAVSAVYFNGSQEVPFIPLVMGAAGSAVLVELGRKQWRTGAATQLVRDVSRVQSAVVFPVFFFFLFFRAEIFELVFDGKYAASVPVFAASLLVLPLRTYHFTVLLESRQEGRIINTGALLDIIATLALLFPFYKIFGLPGVALAPVASTWMQMGYYLVKTAKVYGVSIGRLFPVLHWLCSAAVFGGLLWSAWFIGASTMSQNARLLLGAAVAVLCVSGTLAFEIRRYRNKYGEDFAAQPRGQR